MCEQGVSRKLKCLRLLNIKVSAHASWIIEKWKTDKLVHNSWRIVLRIILDPKSCYRPLEVTKDVRIDYGVTVGYAKAWRMREDILENVRGCPEESCALLPLYFHMLESTNPGTLIRNKKTKYNRYGL